MQCFLINLDRSADRYDWIRQQTDRLGIAVTRVPAVDGRSLSPEEVTHWESLRHPRYVMGPGEFGCFLSHRRAWEAVVESGDPWGFIAEDDIHFAAGAGSFLADDRWVPDDADLIKAETAKQRVWLSGKPAGTAFGCRLHRLKSSHGGSAGYFLSRSAAFRLLAATQNRCSTLDQVLFNPAIGISSAFTIYQMDPAICIQDWCLQPGDGGRGLESLLLSERDAGHGAAHARRRSGAALIGYKISNPIKKLSRVGLASAANLLGTHTVKKVPFQA